MYVIYRSLSNLTIGEHQYRTSCNLTVKGHRAFCINGRTWAGRYCMIKTIKRVHIRAVWPEIVEYISIERFIHYPNRPETRQVNVLPFISIRTTFDPVTR